MKLKLNNLSFRYENNEEDTINNLSLEIMSGEKVAILGKNGMGKSTLFLLANGVLAANSGEIYLDDQLINPRSKSVYDLRQAVGLVFQNPDAQFIAPTVIEEISFAALNKGLSVEETTELVNQILLMLNIQSLKDSPLNSLSGGQKKLVSIASVLSLQPEIIFLDEPTAGLDYLNSQYLLSTLDKLHEQSYGLVISTHDIDFAWEWADRIIILDQGEIKVDGHVQDILTNKELLTTSDLRLPYIVDFIESFSLLDPSQIYPRTVMELENMVKYK